MSGLDKGGGLGHTFKNKQKDKGLYSGDIIDPLLEAKFLYCISRLGLSDSTSSDC